MSTKPQLLEIVQDLLSDMDGDEVNSISDTLESTQIANLVVTTYDNILDEHDLLTTKDVFQLTASGTTDRPTHMTIPTGKFSVEWVKYDKRILSGDAQAWKVIPFLEPHDFMAVCDSRDSTDTTNNVEITDPSNVTLIIDIKNAPNFYTTFNSDVLIFDAYDSDLESTLQTAKSKVFGQIRVDTTQADTTTIDLPHHLFTLLINEAREFAFDLYKDGAPQKVRQMAHRSRVRTQRTRDRLKINRETADRLDYGRKNRI